MGHLVVSNMVAQATSLKTVPKSTFTAQSLNQFPIKIKAMETPEAGMLAKLVALFFLLI